jgi:hypothetical protein
MALRLGSRRFALTVHVFSSVGWFGAVASSLAPTIAGVVSREPETVRGAYLTLEIMGWYALVPFSIASLLTGLVSSLGSIWGLFRHYWVLAKLVINVFATIVLLMYMQSLGALADAARAVPSGELSAMRSSSPVVHAGAALALLVVATVLGVYKPRGMTPYGWRRQERAVAVV